MVDEFLDWCMSDEKKPPNDRARTLLLPTADDGISSIFLAFCGEGHSDMDGKSFLKICKDCSLIDKKLPSSDVDLIFAKVVVKGKRRISLEQFEEALKMIAAKRGVSERRIRNCIIVAPEPVITGTKADEVRFHDDKSTFTGSKAHGDVDGVDS